MRAIGLEPARAGQAVSPRREPRRGRRHAFEVRVHLANPTGMRSGGGLPIDAITSRCAARAAASSTASASSSRRRDARARTRPLSSSPSPPPRPIRPRRGRAPSRACPSSRRTSARGHRARVDGTVIYRQIGRGGLFTWDGTAGLLVQTTQPDTLLVGDEVEVVGLPRHGRLDARARRRDLQARARGRATSARRDDGRTRGGRHRPRRAARDARGDAARRRRSRTGAHARAPRRQRRLQRGGARAAQRGPPRSSSGRSRLRLTGISGRAAPTTCSSGPIGFKLLLRSTSGDLHVVVTAAVVDARAAAHGAGASLAALCLLIVAWVVVLAAPACPEQTEIIRGQIQREATLEDRYRDLFENANDIVFSQDRSGRLTAINRAAEEISGYRRAAELLTRSLSRLPRARPARRGDAPLRSGCSPGRRRPRASRRRSSRATVGASPSRWRSAPRRCAAPSRASTASARDVSARASARAAELLARRGRAPRPRSPRRAGMAEVASGASCTTSATSSTAPVNLSPDGPARRAPARLSRRSATSRAPSSCCGPRARGRSRDVPHG